MIFNDCLNDGKFPHEQKKADVAPVHKNTIFTENTFISPSQSRYRTDESCVNQLRAIIQEIYKSFDEGFEVRDIFLDIYQYFYKV